MAVTGARGFRQGEEDLARSIVKVRLGALAGVTELRTGAQYGVDTMAAEIGLLIYPKARHVVIVPAAPHNTFAVELVRENATGARRTEIVHLEKARDDAAAYRARNRALVEGAELVVAFPSTCDEQVRSGTWMTVRYARAKGVPIMVSPLDNTPGWVENERGERRVNA